MIRPAVIVSFFLLVTFGCIGPLWVMVGGPYTIEDESISVELPQGWRRLTKADQMLAITRDGLGIQKIILDKKTLKSINENAKKKVSNTMLPHEIAEWVLDGIVNNSSLMNQAMIEKSAALIDGNNGYKIVYRYRPQDGPFYKGVQYGYLKGDTLYSLTFEATARYYFDRDLQTFENVKGSYRVVKSQNPTAANVPQVPHST